MALLNFRQGFFILLTVLIIVLLLLLFSVVWGCYYFLIFFIHKWLRRAKRGKIPDSIPGGAAIEPHTIEVRGIQMAEVVTSLQVLRRATNNFDVANVIGEGATALVYKGKYKNTEVAVKRMVQGEITSEQLSKQFDSEIVALSTIRHRNLVSILGYYLSENEKILILEYMPNKTLATHLRNWQVDGLRPLSWNERLTIALDVARGVEYLHSLTKEVFIHRDLKSSNILLKNDLTAKVADFGLMRRIPEGKAFVQTTLRGTPGYIAPELNGSPLSTKADVYSFGVVLMELITARKPLDETKPMPSGHLATWFCDNHLDKDWDILIQAIDPRIQPDEEAVASIQKVAELAGYCCRSKPSQRPDMDHVVTTLSMLVKKWTPTDDSEEGTSTSGDGIDFCLSLREHVQEWQANEGASQIAEGIV